MVYQAFFSNSTPSQHHASVFSGKLPGSILIPALSQKCPVGHGRMRKVKLSAKGCQGDLTIHRTNLQVNPIPSMHGIFTYIWLIFTLNVGKYTIQGWYGNLFHSEMFSFCTCHIFQKCLEGHVLKRNLPVHLHVKS